MRKIKVHPGQQSLPLPVDPATTVKHLPGLRTGPQRLLSAILWHLTPDGVCAAPKAAIRATASLPERTARRYLRELEQQNLIVTVEQPRTGAGMFDASTIRPTDKLSQILGLDTTTHQ